MGRYFNRLRKQHGKEVRKLGKEEYQEDVSFRRFLKILVTKPLEQGKAVAKVCRESLFFRGFMELVVSFLAGLIVCKLLQITSWAVLAFLIFGFLRYGYWCWRDLKQRKYP